MIFMLFENHLRKTVSPVLPSFPARDTVFMFDLLLFSMKKSTPWFMKCPFLESRCEVCFLNAALAEFDL